MSLRALPLLVLLMAAPVLAQEQEDPRIAEARALFERGSELTRQRRFSEAAESYTRSAELVERPSTLFNLAMCHYALGKHLEAGRVFERFLEIADPEEHGAMIAEAREMHAHGQRQVGELTLELLPPDAHVTLNGEPLEGEGGMRRARVNAGTHVVRVDAPHHAPQLLEIPVRAGARVRRAIALSNTFRPSSLVIDTDPDAEVRIDGEASSSDREIDPGVHRVEIVRAGFPPYSADVEVGEAERVRLRLDAITRDAEREPMPRWKHPLVWAAIGVVVAGAAATALALGLRDDDPTLTVISSGNVEIRP